MNVNSPNGNEDWEQFKLMAKSIWSGLSDLDFEVARGSRSDLFAIITRRFGDSRELIASKIDQAIIRNCAALYHILGCSPPRYSPFFCCCESTSCIKWPAHFD